MRLSKSIKKDQILQRHQSLFNGRHLILEFPLVVTHLDICYKLRIYIQLLNGLHLMVLILACLSNFNLL